MTKFFALFVFRKNHLILKRRKDHFEYDACTYNLAYIKNLSN
jgi:hypothetical protein